MSLFRFTHLALCAAALSAFVFAAGAAKAAGGNSANAAAPANAHTAPLGGTWQIEAIKGKKPLAGMRGAAQIEFSAGKAHGQSGCNGFGAAIEQKGAKVQFGAPAATMMACPPPLMRQEQALYQALAGARSYKIRPAGRHSAERLTFYNAKGRAVLALSALKQGK